MAKQSINVKNIALRLYLASGPVALFSVITDKLVNDYDMVIVLILAIVGYIVIVLMTEMLIGEIINRPSAKKSK